MTIRACLPAAWCVWTVWGLAGPLTAQETSPGPAAGQVVTAEATGPPARPASRVLDETGALTAAERAALTREFTTAAESGLSLYFIALNSAEGLTGDDAATDLAQLWEDAPLTAVLLHLPGRGMALGFSGPRLTSLQPAEIDALQNSAMAAGRARQSMPEQGKAAARRLIEDFNLYRAGASLTSLPGLSGTGRTFTDDADQLVLWGGGAAGLFLLGLLLLISRRRTSRPRLFPLTAPRHRFSGPHSGGNNVIISFPNDRAED